MKIKKVSIFILLILVLSSASFAEVTVTSVKGQAKYKTGNQWLDLAPGAKLAQGTKISTGVNSSVVLNINGDTVTVRQMTMLKIEENALSTKESSTKIGLKRGGLNARISKVKTLRTNFRISTPVATSSVRGTEEEVFYGPGTGMLVKVLEGEILTMNRLGFNNHIRGRLEFRQDNHKSSPGNIAGNLIDETKGGLVGNLTDEEKQYLGLSSDLINKVDTVIMPPIFSSGSGSGNVTVTPVFP
ncbi:MAG: FecR domain-containing protein [Spirochaetota bacterium]